MGGFLEMVKDRSRGMLGDLVVENGSLQGFPFYEEYIDRMKKEMGGEIHEATPVVITYGVLRFPREQITKAVQIVGIRLQETCEVNDFRNGLFYEKYYPGTTTLDAQKEPAFGYAREPSPDSPTGYTISHRGILPPELEAAWQKFKARASPAELRKVPIDKRMPYDRPGYFRQIPEDRMTSVLTLKPDPDWVDPALPGAILGTDLCAKRQESGEYDRYNWRGEKVSLTFVPFSPSGKPLTATGMPSQLFRYADDSRTGIYDIDSMSVYVDFERLQKVLQMDTQKLDEESGGGTVPPRTTQIQIKLKPGVAAKKQMVNNVRDRIQKMWDEIVARRRAELPIENQRLLNYVQIQTWEEKQARFIQAVEKEKYLVTTLFGVISLVAVFLVGCIFYMIVQQKTRDIGVVKSIGATSLGVAGIFLIYGAAVGIVGGAIGSLVGTVFVWYINDVQELLAWISPQARIWSPEVYSFDRIPNHVEGWDVLVIYLVAIVASMIGSVVAAFRAARVWPVEALRYE
jgi:lipoprotein-releasing system permease protein